MQQNNIESKSINRPTLIWIKFSIVLLINRKNKEKRPLVLLHDVRSFLSDIKHYFISNPHIGLAKKIERIVNKTSSVGVGKLLSNNTVKYVMDWMHHFFEVSL